MSKWLQLCLNPAVTWPPPQLNSLPSSLPLSCHTSYITLPPPHMHTHTHTQPRIRTTPSPPTGSSLKCHQQWHHSSQESRWVLQGPPPPPCHLGVEQWAGKACLHLIGCPSTSPPRSQCCCCDVIEACLSEPPVKLSCNMLYTTAPWISIKGVALFFISIPIVAILGSTKTISNHIV